MLGRGALLAALASRLGELHEWRSRPAVQQAITGLHMDADAAAAAAQDDDEVVAKIVAHWRMRVAELIDSLGADAVERTVLEEAHALAERAVAEDPFRDLFDQVSLAASRLYADAWQPPVLELEKLIEHPRTPDPNDPYGLTASLARNGEPQVVMQIHHDGLGPAAFAAIPSLLAHECVCHVSARQRGERCNTSVFAEGFMDWAASYFLTIWMPTIDPHLCPAALEHAESFRALLCRPSTPHGAARMRGRRAAERLAAWLMSERRLPAEEARVKVARLAVDLNACDVELAHKDRLVTHMNAYDYDPLFVQLLTAALEDRERASEIVMMQLH